MWVTDLRNIRLRYLKTWFIMDLWPYATIWVREPFWLPYVGALCKILREAQSARANYLLRREFGTAEESGSVPEGHTTDPKPSDAEPGLPSRAAEPGAEMVAPSAPLVASTEVVVQGVVVGTDNV